MLASCIMLLVMGKRSKYICQQCGFSQIGWAGKCPQCGAWGSLVETLDETSFSKKSSFRAKKSPPVQAIKLSSINPQKRERVITKISELDRVLGGGIVPGQVILLAGEPGIGKSTILLQLAENLGNVIYVSGEESAEQISLRAHRLNVKSNQIQIISETNIDSIIEELKTSKSSLFIIDSIQTMYTNDLSGMSGSVGQVRECASRLVQLAKKSQVPTILVGHATKQGSVAGPATLAHMVDTVCWFEGDKQTDLRIIRSHKNRFGPTDEIGIFKMESQGLVSVDDIGSLFMSEHDKAVPGSILASIMEGTRPLLVEIQSLVIPSKTPYPKRIAQGIDSRRIELLLAILTQRAGVNIIDQDVFVNVVGGIVIKEPAADLAIALSLASAYLNKATSQKTLAIGELGLLGEVRRVPNEEKRIKEARRQGIRNIVSSAKDNSLRLIISTLFKK